MKSSVAKDIFNDITPEMEQELIGLAEEPKHTQTIQGVLISSGIDALTKQSSPDEITSALRSLAEKIKDSDRLQKAAVREAAIKKLRDIDTRTPAALVNAALEVEIPSEDEGGMLFAEPVPWPDRVDLAELLENLCSVFLRYIVISSKDAIALALWTFLTYLQDSVDVLPILAIYSPEKRCGKTLVLELLQCFVSRPVFVSNISPAAIFRFIEKHHPTLLIDETDTFFKDNEEIRGIINSGHKRPSAFVIRCTGEDSEPQIFSTYSPKAIAGIGKPADTIEDRSIAIRMRRKAPDEKVERFQSHRISSDCEITRRKIVRWAQDNAAAIKDSDPDTPQQLHDRAQDNWRPLLSIADLAGDIWPELAREAAIYISGASQPDESVKVQLLQDIQSIFNEKRTERISSDDLCKALAEMEERPWPEWRKGKPITPRQLAAQLKPFGIQPRQVWSAGINVRGYEYSDFIDTLSRYVGSDPLER